MRVQVAAKEEPLNPRAGPRLHRRESGGRGTRARYCALEHIIGPPAVIIRLIAILTLLSPALLGWGAAPSVDRSCCEPRVSSVAVETGHCASRATERAARCGDKPATRHACCDGSSECSCGMRQAPDRRDAPKAPLPSRGERDASTAIGSASAAALVGYERSRALMPVRPVRTVILTALRTNNDALAFLSVWRT